MNGDSQDADVKPWGRASTLGLGLIALVAGQMVALSALAWWHGRGLARLPDFSADGAAVTVMVLFSMPVQVGLLWLMAGQADGNAARYLGLVWPRRSEILLGAAAVVAFIAAGNAVTWLLGRNVVTGFQSGIYASAAADGSLLWLWLAVVVVVPVGEELLFRGFLFRGWHRTPQDAWVVILTTGAFFAMLHVQYDLYVIGLVFLFGVMLGWFRWASGSTVLAILLHAMVNFEGMIETMLAHHG